MITKYFGKSKRIFVANIEGNIFDQHVRRGKKFFGHIHSVI